ncbi:Charged multivesicular body protein 7 [Willisornis vidua]|uniref:Charged multivesicular body protein 7 n=1 Tax=Willisornis vidua TaxID=1566151 RepID=A0ABQ9D3R7_9PASS|nr:Charged multivesicular body protein 7 [Willisornis vidua]
MILVPPLDSNSSMRGKLQRESDFMASVDSSWISWGVGVFILKPLKWTLSSVLGDSKVPEEEEVLIYVEVLQEKAEEVYRLYQNSALSSHPVVALSELQSLCASVCPDERTFYLLLLQLQKEKRVTILEQNGEKALRCLKSKRRTERRIEELHSKLDAVQGILDRIYASQTDQMVFNAYQAGVGALKLSMKDVTVERAENLVDQIQELCDTQDEVAQTLAGVGINGLAEMDTEELEKELDSLLQDSTKEPAELPPVPQKVLNPPISDAELEAELERLTVCDGDLAQKADSSASSKPETALGLNL